MTRPYERFAAAFAAVLIMTISFSAVVSVPSQEAAPASAAAPFLA